MTDGRAGPPHPRARGLAGRGDGGDAAGDRGAQPAAQRVRPRRRSTRRWRRRGPPSAASRPGRCTACRPRSRTCSTSSPAGRRRCGGIRALRDYRAAGRAARGASGWSAAGAIIVGKTNSPTMGLRGTTDNYLFGPTRNPWDTDRNAGGSSGGVGGRGRRRHADDRRGHRRRRLDPHPGGLVRRLRLQAVVGPRAGDHPPERVRRHRPVPVRGRDHAHRRRRRARHDRARRLRPARPVRRAATRSTSSARSTAASPGMRIAYSPDLDVFPVDRRVAAVVADAARAFEEAGAHVEEVRLGITRDQRELSDLWCRLIMPINVADRSKACAPTATTIRARPAARVPALARHRLRAHRPRRRARPADAHRGLRRGAGRVRRPRPADQPDGRVPAGAERRRRQHGRAERDRGRRGRPADRLVPDLHRELHRPPGRLDPRRHRSTACRSACRSSAAAAPTPTCSRPAPPSSACGRWPFRLTYSQRSDSGSARIRSTRAGAPATTALSGTSLVTTDEVPTIALSPTVAPRRMQAP